MSRQVSCTLIDGICMQEIDRESNGRSSQVTIQGFPFPHNDVMVHASTKHTHTHIHIFILLTQGKICTHKHICQDVKGTYMHAPKSIKRTDRSSILNY